MNRAARSQDRPSHHHQSAMHARTTKGDVAPHLTRLEALKRVAIYVAIHVGGSELLSRVNMIKYTSKLHAFFDARKPVICCWFAND